jgi:site-specific DNA recombinase
MSKRSGTMTKAESMDGVVRVSRVGERAGDDSYGSPSIQREAMERWATYQNVSLARVFIDEDESGGTQDRPGLVAAIERALSGQTAGIVVYNVSRFSRFTEGGLRDLRRLEEAGARLVFVQEQLDTSTVHGKMIFTILLATHEAALEQIKAGWKVSKARGIREGRQIGPTPPGYKRATVRNGRPKGSLVPDGARGEAITAAYKAVAKERDERAAIPILAEAIPNKTFTVRRAKTAERYGVKVGEQVTVPATWNTTTVRRLLSSRVYLGEAFYGDEIEPNPHAHDPLIDRTTWRVVQRVIEIDEALRRPPSRDYPLSGRVECATCGGEMTGASMGTPTRRAYRCTTNQRRDKHRCPRPATISADPLEAHVREKLIDLARKHQASLETYPTLGELRAEATEGLPEFGPEDLPATAEPERLALEEAEAELAKIEGLRGSLPDAAVDAALETQDRAVQAARDALADAEAEAAGELDERGPISPEEVAAADVSELRKILDHFGKVPRVERGRGQIERRVRLVDPAAGPDIALVG